MMFFASVLVPALIVSLANANSKERYLRRRLTADSCGATFVEKYGSADYSDIPIEITKQEGSQVEFKVLQNWKVGDSVSWIATDYIDSAGAEVCPKVNEVSESVGPYTASCTDDVATVYVYVHDGQNSLTEDNADVPDRCEPSQDQGKKVGYKFTLPCTCGDSANSDTTGDSTGDAAADTTTSTETTTDTTTTDTTTDTTTTDTTTTAGDDSSCGGVSLEEQVGIKYYDSIPIEITKQEGTHVEFNVLQTWKDGESVSWIATKYTDNATGNEVCPKVEEVSSGVGPYTASCGAEGTASITVYMHDGQNSQTEDNADVPDMCEPSQDEGKKVGYTFKVPCSCEDSATNDNSGASDSAGDGADDTTSDGASDSAGDTTSDGAGDSAGDATGDGAGDSAGDAADDSSAGDSAADVADNANGGGDTSCGGVSLEEQVGVKDYASIPIEITKQEGTHVEFNVLQTWKDGESVSWIATKYTDNATGNEVCPKVEEVSSGVGPYTASCGAEGTASITVYMHDGQNSQTEDNADVPDMCEPSQDEGKKVGYTFKVPCSCGDTTQGGGNDSDNDTSPTDESGNNEEDSNLNFDGANAQGGGDDTNDAPADEGSNNENDNSTEQTTDESNNDIDFNGANSQGTGGTPEDSSTTKTTGSGGGYGDPHLKTWRGHVYDFHGECDLVLVRSKNFANGLGLDLHIRTTIRRDWSFISGAALKIGDDVFEVLNNGQYLWNGETYDKLPRKVGGFRLKHSQTGDRHKYKIDLRGEGKILIKVYNEFLAVTMKRADGEYFRDSVGLMGDFEHGAMIGRDGVSLFDNNPEGFGQEWQVTDKEPQLFKELKGPQFPQKCTIPAPLSVEESRRRLDESMVSREDAVKACADWKEDIETCIYDVMSTGDLGMAEAGAM